MRLVIISGLSGSGKSVALHVLEDLGFYCIDNIPVALLRSFVDEILTRLDRERRALAAHTDVVVPLEELNRLRELSDYLGDKINAPLGVILGGTPANDASSEAAADAAASVRATVRRLNELVRKIAPRGRALREKVADG